MRAIVVAKVALMIGLAGLMITLVRVVFNADDNFLIRMLAITQALNLIAVFTIIVILQEQDPRAQE